LEDMAFDGQVLDWRGVRFKATSGLPTHQHPDEQCVPDAGPIPQGTYRVMAADRGPATDDGTGLCTLQPGWGLQRIPRGAEAGECEVYWANWGRNRVRLEPADAQTRRACSPARGGFYLHDSTKGYSHGCIEVEPAFFSTLRNRAPQNPRGVYTLRVQYVPGRATNGGTKRD